MKFPPADWPWERRRWCVFQSVLEYRPVVIPDIPTCRTVAEDKAAGRAWLIHDSERWFEGEKRDGGWWFFCRFCV